MLCDWKNNSNNTNKTTTKIYLYLLITIDINNQQRGNKIQTKKVIATQNNLRVNRAGSQLLVIYKLFSTDSMENINKDNHSKITKLHVSSNLRFISDVLYLTTEYPNQP